MAKKEEKKKEAEAPRECKAADAKAAAQSVDDINKLKELIVDEMCLVTQGKVIDIQKAMAYCRQLMKRQALKKK